MVYKMGLLDDCRVMSGSLKSVANGCHIEWIYKRRYDDYLELLIMP